MPSMNQIGTLVEFPKPTQNLATEPLQTGDVHDELDRARFFAFLGPLRNYLDKEFVTNVTANEDGRIFIEEFGRGKYLAPERMSLRERSALIAYLANSEHGRAMDHLHSRLQCDLPLYGCRVQAFCPPINHWSLIIRVHAKHVYSMERYVEKGEMSDRHAEFLTRAIEDELNIGVAGSVNSGKTTLLNALLHKKSQLHPSARGVIVQDRRELRYDDFEDVLPLMARVEQAHHESNGSVVRFTYEFSDALEDALRSNGDFLVWGEVRDGYSALGLTMALNTGTRGLMMTTHANSCLDTLFRIEDLLRLNGKTPIRRMIARVVDVLVFMERDRTNGRRRVSEVVRVGGVSENDEYITEAVPA